MPIEPVLSAKADILKAIADIYGFKRTLAQAATDFAQPAGSQLQNFEQLVSLSSDKELEASDKPIVQAVDYLLRYAFDNRASRHPHRAQARQLAGAAAHRRRAAPRLHAARRGVHPPIVLAHEDALAHRHLREAPAAGRAHQDRARRPRDRAPRLHAAHRLRREGGASASSIPRRWCRTSPSSASTRTRRRSSSRGSTEPHGLILVTGPTGSGKTTTLYSALKALAGPGRERHHHRGPDRDGVGRRSTRCRCSRRSASTSPARCATSCGRTRTSSWWARSATRRRRRTPSRPRSPATWCSPRCTPTTRSARSAGMKDLGVPPFLLCSAACWG